MDGHRWRRTLVLLAVAGTCALGLASARSALALHATAAQKPIAGDTPEVVAQGKAHGRGHHDPNAVLRVNVGLAVRDSAGLDELIRRAGTPGSPQYGHYLTQAQYLSQYAPTNADVAAVTDWLKHQGLDVLDVSATNLIVHAQGSVKKLERAFGVTINDYEANGRPFHSNDRDPTVAAGLNVNWISGLSNYNVYKVFKSAVTCTVGPPSKCGYDGGDFRSAYHVVGDGSGQTLGLTLWGAHLPQSDYDGYAAATGDTKITVGGAGDDGLDFVDVDGSSSDTSGDDEVALDTQIAHGVAPGIHMTYWLGQDNSDGTLEDVLQAAESSGVKVISNSWGCDGCGTDSNMDTILQAGAATGQTFYFSSGDGGASVGRARPADSPYVVAVGGTNLQIDGSGNWSSETGSSSSGAGCENGYTRPPWQVGISGELVYPNGTCTGRAEPDVAADQDIGTYLYYDGSEQCCIGGTSLAAPIWAAATVVYNRHNANNGRPGVGFAAPAIYGLANDATTYARDFHDITSGNNGFSAGTGWDEVTGWGSADFDNLFNNPADITYTGPHQASKGDSITLSATLLDHGASTPVVGRTIDFAAGADSCSAVTDSSGHASCGITVTTDPGHYSVIAAFGGDAVYVAKSVTEAFTVLHIPTSVTYTGPTSGDYHDAITVSATLTDESGPTSSSSGDPIAGETITFTLGGVDTCSAATNASGVASCPITPTKTGTQSMVASFAGDSDYLGSSDTQSFSITPEETTVTYASPTFVLAGSGQATLTATLVEDGANDDDADDTSVAPYPAEMVTLSIGSQSCTGTTDTSGNVTCTIPTVTVPLGPETVGASFAGDAYYEASSDSTTAVVFAFPSRGAFALGDTTAATAGTAKVTWWADTWWQLNVLTGGKAPAAFKGFVDGTITLPTTSPANVCSSQWTTTGGNSPPPTSEVPSYMGVVVTGQVKKSGSTVSGDYSHVVVVQVNPGYAPDPMDAGTGTILGTFC